MLVHWIYAHVEERGLGIVTTDTGFVTSVEPPTVRGPDIAFFALEGAPTEEMLKGFRSGGPDLAVEVTARATTSACSRTRTRSTGGDVLPGFAVPVARIFALP